MGLKLQPCETLPIHCVRAYAHAHTRVIQLQSPPPLVPRATETEDANDSPLPLTAPEDLLTHCRLMVLEASPGPPASLAPAFQEDGHRNLL